MGMKPRKKIDGRKIPKAKRPKPSTGQSGPPMELSYSKLNNNQAIIVKSLNKIKGRVPVNVGEIHERTKLTKLQIRNAMRNLVRGGWVERVTTVLLDDGEIREDARGHYRLTKNGKDRIRRQLSHRAGSNGVSKNIHVATV